MDENNLTKFSIGFNKKLKKYKFTNPFDFYKNN